MEKHINPIKSYVIRAARMSPAQKKAYADFADTWLIGNQEVHWDKLFPDASRYVVEIGFGMGEATREVASSHPDWGILGVEVFPSGVGKLLWWIEKENLKNIRIAQKDAVDVFRQQIPSNSVDAIHVWFPDPWPKKKHHKRRLITPAFIHILITSLKTGGIIHAATDWQPYAEVILKHMEESPDIENCHECWAPRPDYRPETKFERKGRNANRNIYDIVFEKRK